MTWSLAQRLAESRAAMFKLTFDSASWRLNTTCMHKWQPSQTALVCKVPFSPVASFAQFSFVFETVWHVCGPMSPFSLSNLFHKPLPLTTLRNCTSCGLLFIAINVSAQVPSYSDYAVSKEGLIRRFIAACSTWDATNHVISNMSHPTSTCPRAQYSP